MHPSRLSDLDELVLKVRDIAPRSYIAEAIATYRGGAYRASIFTILAVSTSRWGASGTPANASSKPSPSLGTSNPPTPSIPFPDPGTHPLGGICDSGGCPHCPGCGDYLQDCQSSKDWQSYRDSSPISPITWHNSHDVGPRPPLRVGRILAASSGLSTTSYLYLPLPASPTQQSTYAVRP